VIGAGRRTLRRLGPFLSLLTLVACAGNGTSTVTPASRATASPTVRPPQTATLAPARTPTPTASAPHVIAPGIEVFEVQAPSGSSELVEVFVVARIDPAKATISVRYAPTATRTVAGWRDDLSADVAANAGYFTPENTAIGLVVANGVVSGRTLLGYGGLFTVRAGPPQTVALQWLKEKPYVADRRITQAVESFPMLVRGGKVVDGIADDGDRNRRTFLAVDRSGRLLLGVSRFNFLTLRDLAAALAKDPAMAIDAALNLDGGASSGLALGGAGAALSLDSFVEVPTIIAIKSRP